MMLRKVIAGGLFLSAGLMAGYWTGGLFCGGKAERQERDGRAMPSGLSAMGPSTKPLSTASEQRIAEVWKGRTPAEQMALAAAWSDVQDPETIRELLKNIYRLPSNMSQGSAQAALLNNWLAVEPEAALAWCRENGKKYVAPMLESWAHRDVDAARVYVLGIPDKDQLDESAGAILKVLAKRNPEEAFEFLAEIGTRGVEYLYWTGQAMTDLAETDPQALLARAEGFSAPVRKSCREAAAKALAKTDPAAALAWWEKQPDRRDFGDSLLREMAPEAWDTALAFFVKAGPKVLEESRSAIFYGWGSKDPARVFDMLGEVVDAEGQSLISRSGNYIEYLLQSWSAKDAGAAATAFLSVENPSAGTGGSIARAFAKQDPAAARAWANSITDEATRQAALAALDRPEPGGKTLPPPQSAAELVERARMGEGDYSENDLRNLPSDERTRIVSALAEQSPRDAARATFRILEDLDAVPFATAGAMLANLRPADEADKERLVGRTATLVAAWASQVPQEAARWVETLPAGPALHSAIANVIENWQIHDPAAARTWADSLPDEAARKAALEMMGPP